MSIDDYSTTPGSNLQISGIDISEGCSPAGINNALRSLMADIRVFYDSAARVSGIGSTVQAYDAGLDSIANTATSENQMLYTTASDSFAVTPLTAAGRALLDDADAAQQRNTLGIRTATTTVAGLVEKSTNAENDAGTKADKFPDVVGVKRMIRQHDKENAIVSGTKTFTGALDFSGATFTGVAAQNGSIGTEKLSDNAVTTDKVANGTVTTAKINNNAVTHDKIADASISRRKFNAAILSGNDATLITGTAGSAGRLTQWNAAGDLVQSSRSVGDVFKPVGYIEFHGGGPQTGGILYTKSWQVAVSSSKTITGHKGGHIRGTNYTQSQSISVSAGESYTRIEIYHDDGR